MSVRLSCGISEYGPNDWSIASTRSTRVGNSQESRAETAPPNNAKSYRGTKAGWKESAFFRACCAFKEAGCHRPSRTVKGERSGVTRVDFTASKGADGHCQLKSLRLLI